MTEKNLIRVYTGATSAKRIDIIIKNYTKFIGIVDGYTDGDVYKRQDVFHAILIRVQIKIFYQENKILTNFVGWGRMMVKNSKT